VSLRAGMDTEARGISVSAVYIHLKKACDSVRREVCSLLYNTSSEFEITKKRARLVQMCVRKVYKSR
jgi:hypothetical protein